MYNILYTVMQFRWDRRGKCTGHQNVRVWKVLMIWLNIVGTILFWKLIIQLNYIDIHSVVNLHTIHVYIEHLREDLTIISILVDLYFILSNALP